MRVQELTVEVRDASLNRVGQFLPADLVGFSLVGRFNNVGTWEITLPAEHRLAVALATPGAGIIVSHVTHGVILSGPTTAVENSSNTSDPIGSVKISGVDDSAILAERLAYPTPTTADVTLQTQSHDSVVSVKASTAMYTFVKHNLVNGIAPSVRVVPNLTCASDAFLGSTLTKRARFDILGQLLSEIAVIDGLGFDIKQNDNALEFKVFQPVDRSGYIRMDVQNNTLASTAYGYGLPGLTHAIVAGQGDLEDRQFIQVETAESLAAETLWNRRIEQFIDQRNTDVVDELTQAGLEALAESGSTLMSVDVVPAEGYTMQFGRDWNLGDTVTVVVANQEVIAVVTQVALSIESDGVHVVATVGEPSGVDYDAMIAKSQVSAMKRIDALERVEGASMTAALTDATLTRIVNPAGAVSTNNSNRTGAIRIVLPVGWTSHMMQFNVRVFNYSTNTSFEAVISGYNYSGATWVNPSAHIVGNPSVNLNHAVRFGYTSGGRACVYIGETNSTWTLPQVFVNEAAIGFSAGLVAFAAGWVVDFATAFESVTGTITDTQVGYGPTGQVTQFAGASAPAGFLLCNGAAISRTTYAKLYAVIGTTYGAGDGSTTFNVPDLQNRVAVGKGSGTFASLNNKGGAETHTLSSNEMPYHNHSTQGLLSDGGSPGVYMAGQGDGNIVMYAGGSARWALTWYNSTWADWGYLGWGIGHRGHWAGTDYRGANWAHNNLQPYITLNYIIKT